jgi:adenosylhomocysteine nucleosidase
MWNRRLFLAAVLGLMVCFAAAGEPVTAILGAFDAEVAALKEQVAAPRQQTVCGIAFTTGKLQGCDVVIAQTGIGKVNAAMTTAVAICTFQPARVIFSGIAGGISPKLQPGDLVIAEKTAQHDYGFIGPDGFRNDPTHHHASDAKNPMFFESDPKLLAAAEGLAGKVKLEKVAGKDGERTPQITKGIIVTGDAFIASSSKKKELIEKFKADAVEMEGAAVAQVCYQQKTPCIVIRSISDNADETANIDLGAFYKTAAKNAAQFVAALAGAIADNRP